VDRVITAIEDNWDDAVDAVGLTKSQAESLYGSRILNESTTDGLPTVMRAGWAGDGSVTVETDPPPSTDPVWVHPHRRGGHPVAGHCRKIR
jgi:hypothetical protein